MEGLLSEHAGRLAALFAQQEAAAAADDPAALQERVAALVADLDGKLAAQLAAQAEELRAAQDAAAGIKIRFLLIHFYHNLNHQNRLSHVFTIFTVYCCNWQGINSAIS